MKQHVRPILLGFLTLFVASCKKFLILDPPIDQISPEIVFNNDDAAKSAVTGIYSRMITGPGFASGDALSITAVGGLCADELISYNSQFDPYYRNALTPLMSASQWSSPYQFIYSANAVLEGLSRSNSVNEAVKAQLEGEARFIRAFCYFYLTNLYGDIPLHLTTDYRINNTAVRSSQQDVYLQIIKDLKDAQRLLSIGYYTAERTRPNRATATALLARVYLYIKDWKAAEIQATSLIEDVSMYVLQTDLRKVFLKGSSETIWQLQPNKPGLNTNEGNLFIITNTPNAVSLTSDVLEAFEPGDLRESTWLSNITTNGKTYYFPYKYRISSSASLEEYSVVFRLAEQYLVRAEARIHLNKIELGISDLNRLRSRARALTPTIPAPLPDLSYNLNMTEALKAVEQERRVELLSEWGHRWFDLKRTQRADPVLSPIKGLNWQIIDVLFPIPQAEPDANPLITQNDGY